MQDCTPTMADSLSPWGRGRGEGGSGLAEQRKKIIVPLAEMRVLTIVTDIDTYPTMLAQYGRRR
jgi:hypothetical protein